MCGFLILSLVLVSTALAAPCLENGTSHPWGYGYSPDPSKPCVQMACFDDWVPQNGCETEDGGCAPYGTRRIKGCWEERCQPGPSYRVHHTYEWVRQRPAGCEVTPEFCYPAGYVRRVNCTVRKCDRHNGDSAYNLEIIDFGCPFGDRCLSVGEEVLSGCQRMKCVETAPFRAELRVTKLPLDHRHRRKCPRHPNGTSNNTGTANTV